LSLKVYVRSHWTMERSTVMEELLRGAYIPHAGVKDHATNDSLVYLLDKGQLLPRKRDGKGSPRFTRIGRVSRGGSSVLKGSMIAQAAAVLHRISRQGWADHGIDPRTALSARHALVVW